MRKKRELPRKRQRFVRKITFISTILSAIAIVGIGIAFYFLLSKLQKPLYISPIPTAQVAQADQGEAALQEFEAKLSKKHIEFTTVERLNDAYIVTMQDKSKVTFSTQKDIMSQIASLQYILSHLTMEGRQFSSLDLRFSQPVIVIK